ncbi:HugZ family heme oxygenase [Campylobacter sp. MIT 97-5078]|uniref:HugZ family heme oxygenase n=1 Tax=Campylobacter sp. MIT 97-5078 TaxID=1548153 RepID=UPI0005146082|nr:HugZ family heme oxygenase [Campylobacter sp. MIT 97-5078]KGI55468.1 hypothetical protein LR59_11910 [Campylobacter sp. MIT 97-5078]TQR27052.1 HugZ family heme oxygenase [Campylobacter sp. MIT 97-5078]
MSVESIISHMNDHHKDNLIDLCKKFSAVEKIEDISLKSVDLEGLDIVYNGGEKLRIDFPVKAKDEEALKNAIIDLCKSVKSSVDYTAVKKELDEFKAGFGSICLATINAKGEVECSYAPLIQSQKGDYIYISEVAEHTSNIKNNPNNVEVLFLEDESKAASVILRKRLRYRVKTEFIKRGADFDIIFDEFEKRNGSGGGIKIIRGMLDFHLVKLTYQEGNFVKGFGQAYKIDTKGELMHLSGKTGANPHRKAPHGSNPHTHNPHK